jgi:hypothetical protein
MAELTSAIEQAAGLAPRGARSEWPKADASPGRTPGVKSLAGPVGAGLLVMVALGLVVVLALRGPSSRGSGVSPPTSASTLISTAAPAVSTPPPAVSATTPPADTAVTPPPPSTAAVKPTGRPSSGSGGKIPPSGGKKGKGGDVVNPWDR